MIFEQLSHYDACLTITKPEPTLLNMMATFHTRIGVSRSPLPSNIQNRSQRQHKHRQLESVTLHAPTQGHHHLK